MTRAQRLALAIEADIADRKASMKERDWLDTIPSRRKTPPPLPPAVNPAGRKVDPEFIEQMLLDPKTERRVRSLLRAKTFGQDMNNFLAVVGILLWVIIFFFLFGGAALFMHH